MTGNASREGIMQGYKSRFLLDEDGQALPTRSISAGLDYCGIGPQLAALGKSGRVEFTSALDREALDALKFLPKTKVFFLPWNLPTQELRQLKWLLQ